MPPTMTICSSCGKPISAPGTLNSITALLFRKDQCQCLAKPSVKLVVDDSEESTVSHSHQIGDVIDERYEVLAHLGSGGMGEVYKVRDQKTQSLYALKMIAPMLAQQKTVAKRLEHEAMAARTLTHANIVAVYDVGGAAGGAPYLIMDYIDGDGLDQLLKKEVLLTPTRALNIFIQTAEALTHAHQKGIVHRDLKPSNILLTKTDTLDDIVKIVDFGIAKISDRPGVDKTKLTQTGELMGSPLYMSPEQCRGDELDQRSDIYSLGCVMYEVLSGHPPFAGENPVRIILKHLNDVPPELPNNARISNDLKRVVMRCLEKDPAERYSDAYQLVLDLQRVRDGKPIAQYKSNRKTRQTRRVMAGCAAAAAVVGGIGYAAMRIGSEHPATTATAPPIQAHRPETYERKTLAQWTDAIEKDPNNPDLYFKRGVLHDMRDERTNAVDDYTQALNLKPDFLEAYRNRSTTYAMLADYDKAMQDASALVKLDPDSAQSWEARAFLYQATEQYKEAAADYRHAIHLSDNAYYHYGLATALLKLGDFKATQDAISYAVDNGQNYNAYTTFQGVAGLLDAFRQKFPEAHEHLQAAVNGSGSRGVEWNLMAFYYVASGDMKNAEDALAKAKALETFPARAHRLAGEIYRIAGQYDKAIEAFSAETSLEEYPPGYRERATVYIALNQLRSAYSDLKKSLRLNPHSATTLSYMARVEDGLGMKKEAADHINQAFKIPSLTPMVYVNRATIKLHAGDAKAALQDVNQALSIDQWLKEGYELRAQINDALKDGGAAAADRAQAAKLVSHLDY